MGRSKAWGALGHRAAPAAVAQRGQSAAERPEGGGCVARGLVSASLPSGCTAVGLSVRLAVAWPGRALGGFTPFCPRKAGTSSRWCCCRHKEEGFEAEGGEAQEGVAQTRCGCPVVGQGPELPDRVEVVRAQGGRLDKMVTEGAFQPTPSHHCHSLSLLMAHHRTGRAPPSRAAVPCLTLGHSPRVPAQAKHHSDNGFTGLVLLAKIGEMALAVQVPAGKGLGGRRGPSQVGAAPQRCRLRAAL